MYSCIFSVAQRSKVVNLFSERTTPPGRSPGGVRGCQKVLLFDKEVCGLTAAHALSAFDGQRARLQAEKYFLSRTCRLRK